MYHFIPKCNSRVDFAHRVLSDYFPSERERERASNSDFFQILPRGIYYTLKADSSLIVA